MVGTRWINILKLSLSLVEIIPHSMPSFTGVGVSLECCGWRYICTTSVYQRLHDLYTFVATVTGDKVVQLSQFNLSKATQERIFRLVHMIAVLDSDIINVRLYWVDKLHLLTT